MESSTGHTFEQSLIQKHPCLEHLAALERELHERGLREGELRVGQVVGVIGMQGEFKLDIPAPMLGLEAHSAFEEDEMELARALLLEIMKDAPAGTVKISAWNGTIDSQFKDFATSLGSDLWSQYGPQDLARLLNDCSNQLSRLSMGNYEIGTTADPKQVALLVGNGEPLDSKSHALLETLMNSNTPGITFVTIGIPGLQSHRLQPGMHPALVVNPNTTDGDTVLAKGNEIAAEAKRGAAPPRLESLIPNRLPEQLMQKSAKEALYLPLGIGSDGKPAFLRMEGVDSHAVVVASSGSGKTLFLKTLLYGLQEYSPDEVRLILADGKEGTEFNQLGPGRGRPEWQPHAELLATNINRDYELQRQVLLYLEAEMERRAGIFKANEATNYEQLRLKHPNIVLPRLVSVFDEFQELFKGPHANEMVQRLEDLARKGRSFGMHLILASQGLGGVSAFDGKRDLFKNFGIRVLGREGVVPTRADDKITAMAHNLPAMQMLVQTAQRPTHIERVRIAAAYEDGEVKGTRSKLYHEWRKRRPDAQPPTVFDGSVVPKLADAEDIQTLKPSVFSGRNSPPKAMLGKQVNFDGKSAGFSLERKKGRNLAIVGRSTTEATRILHTAAVSIAKQQTPENAKFVVVCLDHQAVPAAEAAIADLQASGHRPQVVELEEAADYFRSKSTELDATMPGKESTYVLVYGGDSGGGFMTKKVPTVLSSEKSKQQLAKAVAYGTTKVAAGDVLATSKDDGKKIVAPFDGMVEYKQNTEGDDESIVITPLRNGQEHLIEVAERGPESGLFMLSTFSDEGQFKAMTNGAPFRGYVTLGTSGERLPGGAASGHDAVPTLPERGRFKDLDQPGRPHIIMPYQI